MEGIEKERINAKRKAVKSALKMLKDGLNTSMIIKYTELSETEMKLLKAYFENLAWMP